jgi:hypothetical protein
MNAAAIRSFHNFSPSQLYIALDQKYVGTEKSNRLIDDFRKLSIMIHNFMNYLKTTPYKGIKYKQPKQKSMKEEIDELLEEVHKNTV